MGRTTKLTGNYEVSSSPRSLDRERWNKVFNGLVKLLKNRQEQLDALSKERKTLVEHIKEQHRRWVSDVCLLQDHISLMREELVEKEMALSLEAAKSDLLTGLKQREADLHKLTLEMTEDELTDYKALFECLSSDQRSSKPTVSLAMEAEIKRLKREIDKVVFSKDIEISSLMKEKSFTWNQYNILEKDLTSKLNSKEKEVQVANDKIVQLLSHMELLQSRSDEKDQTIERLLTRVSEMEADTDKREQEISKLTQELELLRNSRNAQFTPGLKRCNTEVKTCTDGVKSNRRNVQDVDYLKHNVKSSRSLKRKKDDAIAITETPKLFSAAFKVPKLKTTPTHFR